MTARAAEAVEKTFHLVAAWVATMVKVKIEGKGSSSSKGGGLPACLASVTANALAVKTKRKLEEWKKGGHAWVEDYYNKTINHQKTATCKEKQEFLQNLLGQQT